MVNQENCIIDNILLSICIHLEFLLSKAEIDIRVGEDPAIGFDPSGTALQKRQESQCGTRSGIVQCVQGVLLGWGCHLSAHISLQLHLFSIFLTSVMCSKLHWNLGPAILWGWQDQRSSQPSPHFEPCWCKLLFVTCLYTGGIHIWQLVALFHKMFH